MSNSNEMAQLCNRYTTCQACSFGLGAHFDRAPFRVFYRGSVPANIMFIGEAPGKRESAFGLPFVGPSGVLLDNILRYMGVAQNDFFITNTIICNGDGRTKPTMEAMEACSERLMSMVSIVRPSIIVCLGWYAMYAMMGEQFCREKKNITSALGVGRPYEFGDVNATVFVEYHPAYLLRNPKAKKESVKRWKNISECYKERRHIKL